MFLDLDDFCPDPGICRQDRVQKVYNNKFSKVNKKVSVGQQIIIYVFYTKKEY
jgi:hypothetical protein